MADIVDHLAKLVLLYASGRRPIVDGRSNLVQARHLETAKQAKDFGQIQSSFE